MNDTSKYKRVIKWWDNLLATMYPIPLMLPEKVNKPEFVKEAERLVSFPILPAIKYNKEQFKSLYEGNSNKRIPELKGENLIKFDKYGEWLGGSNG